MINTNGGVTLAEYCATAYMIADNNDLSEQQRALIAGMCADIPKQ